MLVNTCTLNYYLSDKTELKHLIFKASNPQTKILDLGSKTKKDGIHYDYHKKNSKKKATKNGPRQRAGSN
jgi:uncharacterized cupin superfamily protein